MCTGNTGNQNAYAIACIFAAILLAGLIGILCDNILEMQRNGNRAGLQQLQDSLISQARRAAEEMPSPLTEEMRQAYTTVGGAPHLDGQYTVFGEVIEGMDTVERIEATETGAADRPRQDVRIIKMEII